MREMVTCLVSEVLSVMKNLEFKVSKDAIENLYFENEAYGHINKRIAHGNLDLGMTRNYFGEEVLSVFYKNIWLAILKIVPGDAGVFAHLDVPVWILAAIGTPYQENAERLSHHISAYKAMGQPAEYMNVDVSPYIVELRQKLKMDGYIDDELVDRWHILQAT